MPAHRFRLCLRGKGYRHDPHKRESDIRQIVHPKIRLVLLLETDHRQKRRHYPVSNRVLLVDHAVIGS